MPIKIIKPDKRKPGKNGLRGKQGIQGVRGVQGVQGIAGVNGKDGLNGRDGEKGADGRNGSKWYDGKGAPDATLGATGDFYLDNDTYDYYEKTTRWVKRGNLKGAKGDKGDKGSKGRDGGVGTPGADGQQGAQGPQGMQGVQGDPGVGVPTGGTTGQVLAKDSDTDYDTEWVDQTGGGGISIGDTVGGTPANGGILYADSSDLLKADKLRIDSDSYFGGLVTSNSLADQSSSSLPKIGFVNASGAGGGYGIGVTTNGATAVNYLMIDVSTLSARGQLLYDVSTPANSNFTIALANGLGGTPEFTTSISNAQFNVPLDMNSNPITEVDDPTNAQDVATKNYVDTEVSGIDIDSILPSQTGNSGEFLTTDGSNASWATVSASPGGSDTQLQYNNAGSFGGMSNVTKSGDGLLLSTVGNESFIAVGPQGYYGTAFAQDEPHIAINTVRLIGNGGNALVLRNGNNINNITLYSDAVAVNSYKTPSNGIIGFYLTENAPNNAATITAGPTDQGFFARKARLQAQCETGLITADATINTIQAKAQTSQTGNLFDAVNTSGTRLWGVDQNGGMKPASMADGTAANDTVYYSTTASKLVYKDGSGNVQNLY